MVMSVLPLLAPSWILSLAENLASFSLQDGARIGTIIIGPPSQPASQPASNLLWFLCGVPPSIFEFSASAPPHCEHLRTFSCAVSPLILWCYVRRPHRFVRCPPLLSLDFLRRPLWTSENIFLCGVPPDSVVLCAVSQPQYSAVSPPQYKYL